MRQQPWTRRSANAVLTSLFLSTICYCAPASATSKSVYYEAVNDYSQCNGPSLQNSIANAQLFQATMLMSPNTWGLTNGGGWVDSSVWASDFYDPNTGATDASVANADSGVDLVGPLSMDAAVHTSAVLSYFATAGLPQEQIGTTSVTTRMVDKANSFDPAPKSQLVGYSTIIGRRINDVRVAGSYAWARLNANGEAMAEEVYWPELPVEVVAAATQLRIMLADSEARASFLAHIPTAGSSEDSELEVVIRHSPRFQNAFEAHAAVEVRSPQRRESAWYDSSGRELRFASENTRAALTQR